MGDRSSLEVIVYDVPATEAAVVVGSLDNLMMDFAPTAPGLVLGESYIDGQTSIDVPGRLATHLAEHAPGTTFTVVGGSYCPHPAEVHHHVPGLGLYSSDATEGGEPTFTAREVQAWLTEWATDGCPPRGPDAVSGAGDLARLRELVHARSGRRFSDHIDALAAELAAGTRPGRVRAVWPCVGCGRRVRERDPDTRWAAWIHADSGSLMRACPDGAGLAEPDRDAVPVFCG